MELKYTFGDYDEATFEYEVNENDVINCAVCYFANLCGVKIGEDVEKVIRNLISEGVIVLEYETDFIEFLKESYYEEALEAYEDYCEYRRDPYGYYGVSRSDF